MSDKLSRLEARIVRLGIFLLFLVTFGDYVLKKVVAVLSAWL